MELRYCEECGDVLQVNTEQPLGPTEKYLCDRCKTGARPPASAPTPAERLDELSQNLNLFSTETIALKRKQYEDELAKKPKSSRLRLVKPGSIAVPASGPGAAADSVAAELVGSAIPAKSARKILFRCLHCRSTIAIRPVERMSRLSCPKCAKPIYVTPSGRLLKSSPSSVAVRKSEPGEASHGVGAADPAARTAVAAASPALAAAAPVGAAEPAGAGQSQDGSGRSGFRQTAHKDDPLSHRPAPGGRGSARLVKPPSGRTRYGTAEAAKAPAGTPPPVSRNAKPVSAFAEHQANQDPEKTAFITEEPSEDLKDLASSEALAGVAEQFSLGSLKQAPPEPSPSLGALLPDDADGFDVSESPPGRGRGRRFSPPRGARPPAVKESRSVFGALVRGAFVIAAVCAPLVFTAVFLDKEASAQGGQAGTSLPGGWSLDRLGRVAGEGVAKLLPAREEI